MNSTRFRLKYFSPPRHGTRLRWLSLLGLTMAVFAEAKPPATKGFCAVYPNVPACASKEVSCDTCHAVVPARNAFGLSVEQALLVQSPRPLSDADFLSGLPAALKAVESLDSDGDSVTNLAEFLAGTIASDASSRPQQKTCDPATGSAPPGAWNVCGYDLRYAYRKMTIDVCGRTPTFEEEAAFAGTREALHAALDVCFKSEHWRGPNGVVWNLANSKIKPLRSLKAGSPDTLAPLGDYDDDYALFVYSQIDDHDARALLTAQFYVAKSTGVPTVYTPFQRTVLQDRQARPLRSASQPLDQNQRAGMITTRWFRAINTMFTSVPRTTAAQAYRAYLGFDIALLQGLRSDAPDSPDYDNKGIREAGCAVCHKTLDALTYPFSRYEGIDRDGMTGMPGVSEFRADRMSRFAMAEGARILEVPEKGLLLGREVASVVEWAKVASESDEFAQKLVLDYWKLLVGSEPRGLDATAFTNLWKRLRNENNYQTQKMIHDLVDTEAYGAP